jgi:hypothetical protein
MFLLPGVFLQFSDRFKGPAVAVFILQVEMAVVGGAVNGPFMFVSVHTDPRYANGSGLVTTGHRNEKK